MGTTYSVRVVLPGDLPDVEREHIDAELADLPQRVLDGVNAKMSTYQDTSELSRFNQHEETTPFPLSRETLKVMAIAQAVSEQTQGAFDITVGPLVNAWGFGPEDGGVPSDAALAELLKRVGFRHLAVDAEAGTATKAIPGLYCDLSAVAKGYGVDAVAEALEALGVTRYMVEVGGEVRTAGLNARGQAWRIGIYKPDPETLGLQRVVGLSGQAMATSGDYRNFIDHNGERLSHTIDPRTGRPTTHGVASVSVVHESCAWADAYATALMVMPPEAGCQFALDKGLAAYFIIHDGEGFVEKMTPGFEAL